MAGGQLLGGGDGPLGLALVVPGEQRDGAARDPAPGVGLFDREDDTLMDGGALDGQDAGAGVDLANRDRLGRGEGLRDAEQEDDGEP